jgi:putative FmdB family regulatory protein
MPIYEYQCLQCAKKTEWLQRMSDPPLAACPECGGAVKKLISSPAVQFKGSGWYVTDYGKGGSKRPDKSEGKASEGKSSESKSSESSGSSSTASTGGDSGKDSGSKESKTESKPAAKADT